MSLVDFLGSTSELRIIDFLAENMDTSYNQTEIEKCLGISRSLINQKIIPSLLYNNIIEVKKCSGKTKWYGLKKNSLVNALISAIYDHTFMMAEYEEEEEESLSRIIQECQTLYEEEIDCYCGDSRQMNFYPLPKSEFEYKKSKTGWGDGHIALASA